jgi:UDP-N-acetylglucosamine 2-epimerase (non-hydrolysing)
VKVLTVLGTRPEIIRLSLVIEKLDRLCDHVLVHTGQNYDPNLSDVFFDQLGVRQPDRYLGATGSFGGQVSHILSRVEEVLMEERPERFLVLGDTNSGLAMLVAKRLGIPTFHMEAGNRCYDDRVPEEVNRRVIDQCSDILMPYTERSRQNLLREGFPGERIYVTGNPIYEVMQHYERQITQSGILARLNLTEEKYFLVTMHRAENVDAQERLLSLAGSFELLRERYGLPIIISTHPHTRKRLESFDIDVQDASIRYLEPFGFFDFLSLERDAFCVISDSGTVQEECAILGVPNVTVRDVTERPETIECGSNMLSGVEPGSVARCVETVLQLQSAWSPPPEYLIRNVSDTVVRILLGFHLGARHSGQPM